MKRLGCIGTGNMGLALIKGILQKGVVKKENVYIYDKQASRVKWMEDEYGVQGAPDSLQLIRQSDVVLLAVKPNVCASVLEECKEQLIGKAILSIVTGWTRADIENAAPGCRVMRVMPNTPCLVGEGMMVLDADHSLLEDELAYAKQLFQAVGQVEEVQAELMDAVTGVSGSGPAYVYMFIEALADGGVREGLSREIAYKLAAQTVLGAAKMVLDTHTHPGVLKDAVCSPGGTTIEAVIALERAGIRAAVMDAVEVCTQKARALRAK